MFKKGDVVKYIGDDAVLNYYKFFVIEVELSDGLYGIHNLDNKNVRHIVVEEVLEKCN